MPSATTLSRWIPAVGWLARTTPTTLRQDAIAGLTTAVMLVPQAMAYAMLAGLPPIVGLYASVVPLVLYAVFGSSSQLAVGPVAMVSLLVATGVGAVVAQGGGDPLALAAVLALMVGVLQLGMGIGRLGFLTNFLSHPVLSGFTSAAALIIGASQLKHLLGVNLGRSHHVHAVVGEALQRLAEVSVPTLLLGLASVALLVGLKRWRPSFPRALAVVVVSTLAVWGLGLEAHGVAVVGEVPAGLPPLSLPSFDLAQIEALLPTALTIALVGFMESIAVARAFARRHGAEIVSNQELVALGAANLGAAVTGGYPVTGGFSRTAVNDQAGARTPAAALFTAAVVALTLVLLTPLFTHLPKAVLAAIILTAVAGLIDVAEVRHLWKVQRADLGLLGLTFLATLALGIEQGIGVGVGASLLWFVVQTTRPHLAVLGRLPGTRQYRNTARHPQAQTTPGVLVVRMDASFYYGNISFLKQRLQALEQAGGPVQAIVMDCSAMNRLDSSAAGALGELHRSLSQRGVSLTLAGVKGPVMDVLERAGLAASLGTAHLPLDVHSGVEAARAALSQPAAGAA